MRIDAIANQINAIAPAARTAPAGSVAVGERGPARSQGGAHDQAIISAEGLARLVAEENEGAQRSDQTQLDKAPGDARSSDASNTEDPNAMPSADGEERAQDDDVQNRGPTGREIDADDLRQVRQLERRDREVRAHEAAHIAAAGGHARGGASYSYQRGPDGRQYAVGGEVAIDTSAASTPEATIAKMRTIRRAALAPANPSAADRNIAAVAARTESLARMEQRRDSDGNGDGDSDSAIAAAPESAGATADDESGAIVKSAAPSAAADALPPTPQFAVMQNAAAGAATPGTLLDLTA